MVVKLRVNWSGMVYSPTESSDLFLILGCMTSDFLYLGFSTLYFSSLWTTDTIIFAKLNTPPLSNKPPVSTVKKINPPWGLYKEYSPVVLVLLGRGTWLLPGLGIFDLGPWGAFVLILFVLRGDRGISGGANCTRGGERDDIGFSFCRHENTLIYNFFSSWEIQVTRQTSFSLMKYLRIESCFACEYRVVDTRG